MKLVTYRSTSGHARSGALMDDGTTVLDLQAAHFHHYGWESPHLATVLAMVQAGAPALDLAQSLIAKTSRAGGRVLDVANVKLLAPIPDVPQMRDFLCFEKHLVQSFQAARKIRASQAADPAAAMRELEASGYFNVPAVWYQRPIFYHPSRFGVIGHDDVVDWPGYSNLMDFELEFGCYISKLGKDIPKDRAREHIFGYTIFNDFSARDEQALDMQGQIGPGKGKDFDGSNAMGPCLVTADELTDPYRLDMRVRVNGEEWGRGNSSEMHWKFEDCIAHASRSETLHPGEFFGSGTVGNGCGVEHLRFLKSGDVVELEVEGIGVLRNRVRKA